MGSESGRLRLKMLILPFRCCLILSNLLTLSESDLLLFVYGNKMMIPSEGCWGVRRFCCVTVVNKVSFYVFFWTNLTSRIPMTPWVLSTQTPSKLLNVAIIKCHTPVGTSRRHLFWRLDAWCQCTSVGGLCWGSLLNCSLLILTMASRGRSRAPWCFLRRSVVSIQALAFLTPGGAIQMPLPGALTSAYGCVGHRHLVQTLLPHQAEIKGRNAWV